jgi:hypothetical protein
VIASYQRSDGKKLTLDLVFLRSLASDQIHNVRFLEPEALADPRWNPSNGLVWKD